MYTLPNVIRVERVGENVNAGKLFREIGRKEIYWKT
jgi:hypothetical protein